MGCFNKTLGILEFMKNFCTFEIQSCFVTVVCNSIWAVRFARDKYLTGYFLYPLDFDLSETQQEHALAVERLSPRLAALRIELCPGYMRESCFWKIYFVLVHPRLDKKDAELLSTPQVLNY